MTFFRSVEFKNKNLVETGGRKSTPELAGICGCNGIDCMYN